MKRKMNEKDQEFFEANFYEWIDRNLPPRQWDGSIREWAELEMICRGRLGRLFFKIEKMFQKLGA